MRIGQILKKKKKASITVTKSRSLEKEPRYPVIRKITARWKSDGLTYTGFLQELDETAHSVTISEHPDEKYIEIAVTEKDLSNDRCVIDAIVGYVMFEDLSGNTVSKRIEVRKE